MLDDLVHIKFGYNTSILSNNAVTILYSGLFSRIKIFTHWPFPDFPGKNFHESSRIIRSTY